MNKTNVIKIMSAVFEDMDKDFTIWEYRTEIKYLLDFAIKFGAKGIPVSKLFNKLRKDKEIK